MKKYLAVILSVLVLQMFVGCEKEHETLERIVEHINILEEKLPDVDKEYLEINLLDIKSGEIITSPSGELPSSPSGVAFWYNRDGKLDDNHVFDSNEYRHISRELIMKYTDGKLIGQYYLDENYDVYYFGGRRDSNQVHNEMCLEGDER